MTVFIVTPGSGAAGTSVSGEATVRSAEESFNFPNERRALFRASLYRMPHAGEGDAGPVPAPVTRVAAAMPDRSSSSAPGSRRAAIRRPGGDCGHRRSPAGHTGQRPRPGQGRARRAAALAECDRHHSPYLPWAAWYGLDRCPSCARSPATHAGPFSSTGSPRYRNQRSAPEPGAHRKTPANRPQAPPAPPGRTPAPQPRSATGTAHPSPYAALPTRRTTQPRWPALKGHGRLPRPRPIPTCEPATTSPPGHLTCAQRVNSRTLAAMRDGAGTRQSTVIGRTAGW
jgi:hypothetical protein